MKIHTNRLWVALAVVWAGVFSLTYWNVVQSQTIKRAKEQKEIFMRDNQFWARNEKTIVNVLQMHGTAFHDTESIQIGLLHVESRMASIARKQGLTDIKMEKGAASRTDRGEFPVELFFSGAFGTAFNCLKKVAGEMPFLVFSRIHISASGKPDQGDFHLSVKYRYEIKTPEST